ncbi:MAG: DUF934 domain-containing protein [Gammaproteobacteria bacterium]|nr:DUF934 domain-containing protein [Gammaproteobacteria bacterium]
MRYILRQREVQADPWRRLDEPHAAGEALLVPAAELRREPARWWGWSGRLGVQLAPPDRVEELEEDLRRLDLVAVEFPAFGEGRGFSQARLLRERYGFRGELRATGRGVTPDSAQLLVRCGFDAFEVASPAAGPALLAACERYDVAYQPGAGGPVPRLQRFRRPS